MGRVTEFQSELFARSPAKFGQWRKIDLHNHSPTSFDYSGNHVTAAELTANKILENDLSVVMFTDHEKLPDAEFMRQLARRTKRLILPGVELNVFVDSWDKQQGKVGKNLYFHLLLGFNPDGEYSPEFWLTKIYNECGKDTRKCGDNSVMGVTGPITKIADIVRNDAGGIIIPAHLHSTADAFKSRSIDDLFADEEFLKVAGSCFTALEVTDIRTATFFDGQHSETGKLRKTCIRSSDAHEPAEIGRRCSFAQMEELNFNELKAALEMPFRVSIEDIPSVSAYVVGLKIDGNFLRDFWISLSPHCNAFIGVKGSGKTSVLECLRFALGTTVPSTRVEEVNAHLNFILGPNGKVQVLVKRKDGAIVLIERSPANRNFSMTFEDDRTEVLTEPEALQFPAQILGWHEIEQAATDPNIRLIYLDSIGSRESLRQLKESALAESNQVRTMHDVAANRYSSYRAYATLINRLEEQRKGLQELTDGNLIELKRQFEAAVKHRDAVQNMTTKVIEALAESVAKTSALKPNIDRSVFDGDSPISQRIIEAAALLDELNSHVETVAGGYSTVLNQIQARLAVLSNQIIHSFGEFQIEYSANVDQLPDEKRRILESHQRVMEETSSLERLKSEQSTAREETIAVLKDLVIRCEKIANLLDRRADLRRTKVAELNDELSKYDVKLSVGPLAGTLELDQLAQRHQLAYTAYNRLKEFAGGESRNHRRLAMAYKDLIQNINSGFSAFFEAADYGHFLSYFEEDDLKIALKVGRAGEIYTPIDQLSAGQRCTAIFPLLLRLKDGPLIVDQPEDNLDNRHIATTISPSLSLDKRSRQISFTSHNANLIVLSDAEHIAVFESDGTQGRVEARGFLSSKFSTITKSVIDIVDGGEYALRQRAQKYGSS